MSSFFALLWKQILALSPVEVAGVVLSLLSVVLTARQNIWNFSIGIVACAIYVWVFGTAKLYADAALQIFFIAVCVWGWWRWARGQGENAKEELSVSPMPLVLWPVLLVLFVVGTGVQGFLLARHTDAAAPYVDSGIFWASVGAQWMIGRKYVENWLIWIGVDIVATGLYWTKGLYPTSILYALLTVLAVWGFRSWLASQKTGLQIAPQSDGPPIPLP